MLGRMIHERPEVVESFRLPDIPSYCMRHDQVETLPRIQEAENHPCGKSSAGHSDNHYAYIDYLLADTHAELARFKT